MFHSFRRPARPAGQFKQTASVGCAHKLLALAAAVSILFAGSATSAQSGSCVLDPTFDRDGKKTSAFVGVGARDVALQPDGKIIATGTAEYFGLHGFGLARYNSDGSLDDTFGDDGKVIDPFPDYHTTPNAVKLRPDGKIVVAG